jgi:hypothetical protein
MKLTPHRLDELSEIKYEYFTSSFPSSDNSDDDDVLIVAFHGSCGFGSGSNADRQFMSAMTKAGLAAFEPLGLILDMTDLVYEWGDMMSAILGAGDGIYFESPFPTVVIVSSKCLDGLTSLVRDEMDDDPAAWLYSDLSSALAAVERLHKKY